MLVYSLAIGNIVNIMYKVLSSKVRDLIAVIVDLIFSLLSRIID